MGIIIGLGQGAAGGSSSLKNMWYGVRIYKGALVNEDERVQRIAGQGYMYLHITLPIQSAMKRCLLLDNGQVNYYLDQYDSTLKADGTPAVLDGTDGQLMVELTDTYFKFEEDADYIYCKLSPVPIPGFSLWKRKYVSAVEATVQKTGNKLSSVLNWTNEYCGGDGTTPQNGSNQLCRPRTALSLTSFRQYAQNRGANWQCYTYGVHKQLYWYFIVEYATLNSQKEFNGNLTPDGYHQGGLGPGMSQLWDWGSYNNYYPVLPCGTTVAGYSDNDDTVIQNTLASNKLGNFSGEAKYTLVAGTYGTSDTYTYPNSYRGVENPFAHIWKWTDGLLIRENDSDYEGQCVLYTAEDPAKYADTLNAGYSYAGIVPNYTVPNGYIKEILCGPEGNILPKSLGASDITCFCDYYSHNISLQAEGTVRGVLFGGAANNGASCGFAFAYTRHAPSGANRDIGSRLCFYP